ncbi:non-ribosomal peptide synthetase [Paraburkholderia sp. BL21I4N1]|uniref:non-ribosomal peptide synthetase n=1 Tax=Paraburkholderia sp. BL21I4N1 TaxID=1938801 RepID=UPI000CFAD9A2|nr:non-ribosomal peptide synthetase [Paraburkholderia sp. BL21I4N1]PQV54226.1 non-ribosomal peptide synthase protein (TIGR01720 family)/amino acid adenylation domain-containing protein [Paraburkholderia sp. BL21I4N1]
MNNIAQDMLAVSRRYADLTPERRAAFRQRFAAGGHDLSDLPIVRLRERGERLPLSHAQERLWFLWKLEPHSAAYNMVGALRLAGDLDVARLRAALDTLVARHASLRTRFGETEGVAWQHLAEFANASEAHYGWHEVDHVEADDLDAALQRLSRAPFDLERGPLFNVTLLRQGDREHVLHLALHHIVSDGWSQAILQKELGALYRAGGEASALDALSIEYGDYALWQREWLEGAALDAQLDYWRATLGDSHPVLELPADRVRRGLDTPLGGSASRTLGAARRERLGALSRELGVTLFATLFAGWDALLYRYTGQPDIRIGTPAAGRDRLETEGVVGFFVNTLVIRANLHGGDTFGALARQIAQRVLDAQANQDVPFARVVDALQPPRSLTHTPLFQSMFSYAPGDAAGTLTLPGLTLDALDADTGAAKFDLMLHVVDDNGALRAQIDYAADLFDAATIDALLDDYLTLLDGARVETLLRDLPLHTRGASSEPSVALSAAGHTPVSVVELFAAQVAARGPHDALVCEDRTLDYASLDAWATRIATALARHGDSTDRTVVLCTRRTPALVAGLLGILKAGGAYLPIDPDYPDERITAMLARSNALAIVTDSVCAARFAERFGNAPVVLADTLEATGDAAQTETQTTQAQRKPHPQQLAYTIFTSGSSGEPKQVGVPHGALAAHLREFVEAYSLEPADRILQFATISFDVATEQLLAPLVAGATVVMRGDALWDMATLNTVFERERVTGADLPTAYWLQWLNHLPAQALPALRWMSVGGEPLPGDGLRRWLAGPFAGVRFDNQYGPTEAVISSLYRTTRATDADDTIVSIGHAYPQRRIAVLDAEGNVVPLGGLGELCLGGDELARGYLGAASATADRFVPDPHGEPGARLYRTGDLVRIRRDGRVDFIGRADQQLKLRGFRIEPGEIEAAMRSQPGVREALVALHGEGASRRLVGYVVGSEDEAALRAALEQTLPDYMVPQAFVHLDALPLMANGKVDRNALPAPEIALARVAPSTAAEHALLAIWRTVLGRDDLGVTDNFFEAGGDSILSLQIVARARQAGYGLGPRQVFEHPTVERLARLAEAVTTPTDLTESREPLDLTPIQQAFFEQFPHGENHWNQAALLRVEGELDEAALRAALDAIVGTHDALRLRFFQRDGAWRQQVSAAASCALDVFDWRERDAWQEALEQAGTRLQAGLDLANGPLVRAGYFRLRGEGRLLVAIHHLAVDGVSWRVLLDDLQTAYAQALEGRAIELEAGTPWSVWVERSIAYAQDGAVRREAPWWRDALSAARTDGGAPAAFVAPAQVIRMADTLTLETSLDAATTRRLVQDAPKAYRTNVEEVLLAALAQAVRASNVACGVGERGVLLALEGHGREALGADAPDLSRSVGWFTTRYPLWLEAHDDARDALIDAKARRRAVPHNGLHWGLLSAYGDAATKASLAGLPTPRVGFNYLGQFDSSLDKAGRFGFAEESAGESIAANASVDEPLAIVARIANGALSVTWRYAPQILATADAHAFKALFERSLEGLIQHAVNAQPEATAADFALAGLSQAQFESLGLDLARVEDIYPATPVQQGLLFHSALESGSGLYVNQRRLTLRGELDRAALRSSWKHAVASHAILRTQFETRHGGDALQVVLREVDLPYAEHDWSSLDAQAYETRLHAWMREDVQRGFEAERAPLLRIALFVRADGAHDLIWTDHHVLLDGWSSAQLMREVADAYEALLARREPVRNAPPYRDYVQWRLQQDEGEAWWREQAARVDEPATLLESLGLNTGRALEVTDAAEAELPPHESRLGESLSDALRDTARRHRVTLNTVLQGAWALLLSRYGNRNQVAFGVTVSGRPAHLPEVEQMLGLFINSLPVWVDVPGDMPLSNWLDALQQHNGALRQYEHTPLSRIQQWTARSGDGQFDTLLVFENYPVDAALRHGAHGVAIEQTAAFERTHVPLTLSVMPDARIGLRWSADTTRVDRATIERLDAHFHELLTQIAAQGDPLLRTLTLASTLAHAVAPRDNFAFESVLERIAAQTRARPDAIALTDGDTAYTYDALDRWSNQIAHRLLAAGVRADECVGLCMERSAALVAGVLGILKAGAAYVPLDPTYPAERLAYMLDHSRTRRVVADPASATRWADLLAGCELLLADAVGDQSELTPPLRLHPEQLAYVIYTSGSTGRPKGVAITHANVARLFAATDAWYGFGPADVWPLFHAYAFDVSVWELFGCLTHGGRLVIVPYWTARDPSACHRLLRDERVTVLNQTPSAFMPLMHVDLESDTPLHTLHTVIFAGEKLEPASLHAWLARGGAGAPRVVNMYGITETTVHSSYRPLSLADTSGDAPRSVIGVAIPDLSLPILDTALHPVADGAAGELHVGGAGLARGYLHAPGLTAARFVPDPFGAPGSRMYKSGDLARRLVGGEPEYIGRNDFQVKVRGYRIELGEIEAALLGAPAVREVAVLARPDASGVMSLVAYIVPRAPEGGAAGDSAANAFSGEALKHWLDARLPPHMVPTIFVALDALPLTSNGKLDRRALPAPQSVEVSAAHVEPQTDDELAIAQIWQDVLGVARVGRDDHFFLLGGHSLLAMRAVARTREVLKRTIALPLLFTQPVLKDFAAALSAVLQDNPVKADAALSRIEPRPAHLTRVPLTPAQQRLWFLWKLDPASPAYTINGAVRLEGLFDVTAARAALDALIARHESLRMRIEETDGAALQSFDAQPGWQYLDLDAHPEQERAATLAALGAQPFDLLRGPVLRVSVLRLGAREHLLHFSMHHIVSDRWSQDIVLADFAAQYTAQTTQQTAPASQPLAPLAVAFGDYALWQSRETDATALAAQLDYWRNELGDEHPVLELPFDRARSDARGSAGAAWRVPLDAALGARVHALAARRHATPFMVLLAAWQALLQRYSGQHEIRVGVPVAGRDRSETHELVGCFVNTLVVRATLRGCEPFAAVLDAARERVIAAQANQDVPFAQLVDALHPQRSLRHTPLFQAMFNYAKADRAAPALPGLAISNVDAAEQTARFDLTLNANDTPDALTLSFGYATDVFDEATIARIAAHYVELLEQVLADDTLKLGDIALADATPDHAAPRARSFAAPFAAIDAQARRQPEAVAIVCEGAELRYGELRTRSDQLAARLRTLAVGVNSSDAQLPVDSKASTTGLREARVGLCVARSPALPVGLLGIMKSGAAFVPLDPAYPPERLAYMLADAGVQRVVADRASAAQLAEVLRNCEVLTLDAQGALDDDATCNDKPLAPLALHPSQLAYVIYTSGSTGQPKGVAIDHAALAEHLADFIGTYHIAATDTQLQSSTINFDVALHELLPSLMQGGRVVMRGPEMWDLATMSRTLIEQQVSFARIPTAYWQQWLRTPPARGDLARLRQITVGGEALPGDALAQWRDGPLAGIALDNLYGPTETTVACLHRRTTAADAQTPVVSIGTPYPSRTARIYDDAGNAVPALGVGELCIGGLTMARGYLGRAALTADRFVPDPRGEPGSRMYRSGDLCRARADGRIDFLGRLDQQVKLRGFRIELGEIETAVREQPGVREALVDLRGSGAHKRLVCYLSGSADIDAVRAALDARLPEHMVPAVFVALDALPMMQNGKVDRRALPDPDEAALTARSHTPPSTPREAALLAIWQRVLGREALGVHENFFEVGGDSILSLQIVARAAQAGLRITPRQLFEQPTVARLAAVALDVSAEDAQGTHAERHEALPLTPIQADFFRRYPHGESHWNQAALLSVAGTLDSRALEAAVRALVSRHDALRVRFEKAVDGAWVQRVTPAAAYLATLPEWVESIDLSGEADWRAALEREGELLHRDLDLQAGPLMRAAWFKVGADEGRLFVVIHHAVVDGVSWRILLDEFETLYASAARGEAPDAALAAPLPWSAWVEQAARYAAALPARSEADKWRTALAGASAALPVERDESQADMRLAASRVHTLTLDRGLTEALLREPARAYRMGADEVLLAALAEAVASWSGAAGALIGLEGHGREEIDGQLDLSGTIGWFTTRFPVWIPAGTQASPNATRSSPRDALRAAKQRLRAIEHKGLHWGMLTQLAADPAVRAELSALPAPRIGFNYLGQTDQVLERNGRFGFASESTGAPMSGDSRLKYVLDLNGAVENGMLAITWRYSPDVLDDATVSALADAFRVSLGAFVEHCARAPAGATAEDFPLAQLDAAQLDALDLPLGDVEDIYPATPLQQGLLFHSLLQQGAGVYINQKRLTLRGTLDRDALAAAWRLALERHAILRTHFEWRHGGEALQIVRRRVELPVVWHDWRNHDDYEAALAQWRAEDLATPFDLRHASLMRLNLFARPDGAHDLVWTDHHALLDGWSAAQLMGEVIYAYRRETAARDGVAALDAIDAPLPAATPYREYVRWRQNQPAAQDWWRAQLQALDEVGLLMPSLRGKQAARQAAAETASHAAGVHRLAQPLGATLSEALRAAAALHRVTLNTLFQAAWAALLARHANRRRIAFGVTVSGRPPELPGIDGMLGLFINSLPVWTALRSDEPLGEWLAGLQQHNAALRQHEHTPLREVRRWAAEDNGGESGALFDTLVVFENYPIDAGLREGDTGLEVSASETLERTHYPLTLAVSPGEALSIQWNADAAQLDAAVLDRLAAQYAVLLEQIARPATRRVGDLHVPRGVLPFEGGDLAQAAPVDHAFVSLAARFAAQAAQRPDALAVVADDARVTYAELDAWSDRVAAHLLAQGVGREEGVGVAFERSAALIAALLGVLKAGAAYVPLDPSYPRERLDYLLDDAGIVRVLADKAGIEALAHAGARIDLLDIAAVPPAPANWRDAAPATLPAQLAYVIYTSGSTGQPKGVAISQHSAARLFDSTGETFGFHAGDVWSMCHSYAFDFSVWEIFGALTTGARLAVAPAALARDVEALHCWLGEQGVSVLNQTPSAFMPLMRVDAQSDGGLAGLRVVIFGGEKLEPQALAGWSAARRARGVEGTRPMLVNMYGITETTVHVTCRPLADDDLRAPLGTAARSVIGAPLDDLALRVLDDDLNVVPEGATGELCVGGAGLARGYLGRAALTAERFVPDPYGAPGARLYRSGDLAIHDADGEIDYVGRNDFQTKIRGYRIETGEIRARLLAHPAVRDAAVLAVGVPSADGGASAGLRLAAWIVPNPAHAAPDDWSTALRAHLREQLPDYMVPSWFATLDALPLTVNGKLDSKALPLATAASGADSAAHVAADAAPATPTEVRLAAIWQTVLGGVPVGVRAHFFEQGGDSLATLRVAELARAAGFARFAVGMMFEHPVLADLAAALDELASDTADEAAAPRHLVRLNAGDAPHRLFAIHPGYGLVAGYRALAQTLAGQVEVIGVEYPAFSDGSWRFTGLQALARQYADAIRRTQPRGPYALLGWSFGGMIATEVARVLEDAGESVAFVGLLDVSIHPEAVADTVRSGEVASVNGNAAAAAVADTAAAMATAATAATAGATGSAGTAATAQPAWRDHATPEEVAMLAARVPAWLAQADDDTLPSASAAALVEHAALAQANAALALRRHWPTAPRAPLSFWWAARGAARSAAKDLARWQSSGVKLAGSVELDAAHDDIAWHPALLESLRATLREAFDDASR